MVIAEEHHEDEHKRVDGDGARQVCPLQAQVVPVVVLHAADESDEEDCGEEPGCVHQLLHTIPIAVGEGAGQEELEILGCAHQTAVLPERCLMPREPRGHIEGGVDGHRDYPHHNPGPHAADAHTLQKICNHIIDDEHVEQYPAEPIAALGGNGQSMLQGGPEMRFHHHQISYHADHRRHQLYLHFLPKHGSKILSSPDRRHLVCQEAADEEKGGHTEEHHYGDGCALWHIAAETHPEDVVHYHKQHSEAAQGIKPLQAKPPGGLPPRWGESWIG